MSTNVLLINVFFHIVQYYVYPTQECYYTYVPCKAEINAVQSKAKYLLYQQYLIFLGHCWCIWYIITYCIVLYCRLFSLAQKYDNKVKLSATVYGGLVKAVSTHQQNMPPYGDSLPDWVSNHITSPHLTHSPTYILINSLIHLLKLTHTLTQIHSLTHSLTQSLTHSLTHLLTHLLTNSLAHSLTHSFTHSHIYTHSLMHLLTHSFTIHTSNVRMVYKSIICTHGDMISKIGIPV